MGKNTFMQNTKKYCKLEKYIFTLITFVIAGALFTGCGVKSNDNQSDINAGAAAAEAVKTADENTAIPTIEINDEELSSQLQLIMDNRSVWDLVNLESENPDMYYGEENYYYAITDLNQNGRLEILNSVTLGNSWMNYNTYYEVNEAKDGLTKIAEKQMPISKKLNSGPTDMLSLRVDIQYEKIPGYYDRENHIYHYEMENHVYNSSHEFTDYNVDGCIVNGIWQTTAYAYHDVSNKDGATYYSYLTGKKKKICENRYNCLSEECFEGMTKFYMDFETFQTLNKKGTQFSEEQLSQELKNSYENFKLSADEEAYHVRLTDEENAELSVPNPENCEGVAEILLRDSGLDGCSTSMEELKPYMVDLRFAGLEEEMVVTNFERDDAILYLSAVYGEDIDNQTHYIVALDYKNHKFYTVQTGLAYAGNHWVDFSLEELTNDGKLEILAWNVLNGYRSGKTIEIYRLDEDGFHNIYSNTSDKETYDVSYGLKGTLKDNYKLEITCEKLGYHTTESLLDLGYTKKELEVDRAPAEGDDDNPYVRIYDHKKLVSPNDDSVYFGPLDEEMDVEVDYWEEGICGWLQMNYNIYMARWNRLGILTVEMQYDEKQDYMVPVEMEFSGVDCDYIG